MHSMTGDTGMEPGTSALEVWGGTNEPPQFQRATTSPIQNIRLICTRGVTQAGQAVN